MERLEEQVERLFHRVTPRMVSPDWWQVAALVPSPPVIGTHRFDRSKSGFGTTRTSPLASVKILAGDSVW
jgi:hypothetical protein